MTNGSGWKSITHGEHRARRRNRVEGSGDGLREGLRIATGSGGLVRAEGLLRGCISLRVSVTD